MAAAAAPDAPDAPAKKRVAVLISGRGSNMMALVDAAAAPNYPAEIAAVISNRPNAAGLAWAHARGIATTAIDHTACADREAFDAELSRTLAALDVDLIACAGFMRILTAGFVARWGTIMLNIHPSLLPAFKGLDTHARALAAGVTISGCTVHRVSADVDAGTILGQAAVPVCAGDTPDTLAARILIAEHRLYPHILKQVANGQIKVSEKTDTCKLPVNQAAILFSPPE